MNQCGTSINRMKYKNNMIMSIAVGKAFDKVQYPFLIKILNSLRIEGKFLNITKEIYEKSIVNIITKGENLEAFPLRFG